MSFASSSSSLPGRQCSSNRLQDLDIRAIIDLLDQQDVQALIATGDRALACAIHPHITVLRFKPHTCSRQKKNNKQESKPKPWPSVLSQPLTRLTCLKFFAIRFKPNFASLPPTLTRLSMKKLHFLTTSLDEMDFTLPNLAQLTLVDNTVINTFYKNATLEVQWIVKSVCSCSSITALKYEPIEFTDLDSVVRPCIDNLPLLSKLHIPHMPDKLDLSESNIDTLVVCTRSRRAGWTKPPYEGKIAKLPKCLTSLRIGNLNDDETKLYLLKGITPCSLRHLTISGFTMSPALLQTVSSCTRLESLEWKDASTKRMENLSLLPRSLKKLSHCFVTDSAQWANLPPNVQFVHDREPLPVEFLSEHRQYMPKTILALNLKDQTIDMPLSHLSCLSLNITDGGTAAKAISSAPPTLTSLKLSTWNANTMCTTMAQVQWLQMPNLRVLKLIVWSADVVHWMVERWISNLHPNLHQLMIQNTPSTASLNVHKLSLEDCPLPANLTYLHLYFPYFTLVLPRALPKCMRQMVLAFHDVHLAAGTTDLNEWPGTLKSISFMNKFLKTRMESGSESDKLMVSAFQSLQARLGKNRCGEHRLMLLG